MNEKVSVIISTYNEPLDYIEKSLNSIVHQTYTNIELILINDNPGRGELDTFLTDYASSDNRIIYVKNEINVGLTASLNKGIKFASGVYIARMDADDISEIDRIDKQINNIKENGLDLVGAFITKIDEEGACIGKLAFPVDMVHIRKYLRWGDCMPHPTWLCKKSLYDNLAGYREITGVEDYDFVLRAILSGAKLGNVGEYLLNYRIRSGSISVSNNERQQLISNLLAHYYSKGHICSIEEIESYISSRKYANDYKRISSFQNKRAGYSGGKKSPKDILSLLANRYSYIYGIQHIMKSRYSHV